MVDKTLKAVVVYCSPAGTTRHVARAITGKAGEYCDDVREYELGSEKDDARVLSEIGDLGEGGCLFIGSPVYALHAVPPVTRYISRLSGTNAAQAVPFVTWGGVSSGIALYEMAVALEKKGIKVIGGASVPAVHSLMWQSDTPFGASHPDSEDDERIEELVTAVYQGLSKGAAGSLDLSGLSFYPPSVRKDMELISLEGRKDDMPVREVNKDLCTLCKVCSDVCPTDAISFTPYPEFGSECIFCFNCIKECPEDAIKADFSGVDERVREMARRFNEPLVTRVFVPVLSKERD